MIDYEDSISIPAVDYYQYLALLKITEVLCDDLKFAEKLDRLVVAYMNKSEELHEKGKLSFFSNEDLRKLNEQK